MASTLKTTLSCAVLGAGLLSAGLLSGCRGEISDRRPRQFFPDMDDQPKYKAQSESEFFREFYDEERDLWFGRTMREPVAGTVAFGRKTEIRKFGGVDFAQRAEMLPMADVFHLGGQAELDENGDIVLDEVGLPKMISFVERAPLPVTHDLIELGREKYSINCLPCHGGLGDGQGLVGQRWGTPLPTWHDPQYQRGGEKGQDGVFFYAIRNGVGNPGGAYPLKMPSYGRKLTIHETWAIVAYVRALQRSQSASAQDVPPSQRTAIERTPRSSDQPSAAASGVASPRSDIDPTGVAS